MVLNPFFAVNSLPNHKRTGHSFLLPSVPDQRIALLKTNSAGQLTYSFAMLSLRAPSRHESHPSSTEYLVDGKAVCMWVCAVSSVIPTRCRDLHLKRFCLEDVVPATLIILIAHIILAIRWMLIKILSVVINHHGEYKVIVVVGLGVL